MEMKQVELKARLKDLLVSFEGMKKLTNVNRNQMKKQVEK